MSDNTFGPVSLHWDALITARSSVAHDGETRGTITNLRRERIVTPTGATLDVPIISGNSLRGMLRRHAETMLREVLRYDGAITLPAAHALRGGGALSKASSAALTGRRLAELRALNPVFSIFGAAAGGRISEGCLQVGKVLPHFAELAHLLPHLDQPPALSMFSGTQLERYARLDNSESRHFPSIARSDAVADPEQPARDVDTYATDSDAVVDLDVVRNEPTGSQLMTFRVETFPAGTQFSGWFTLVAPTPLEAAFFQDLIDDWASRGRLGSHGRIGHGSIHAEYTAAHRGDLGQLPDWRSVLAEHRDDAVAQLRYLT
ncbi:hypothetical protein GS504_01775 [Rhodococcus hoagii]|nr:hypothetical protein [Prescottella equi]